LIEKGRRKNDETTKKSLGIFLFLPVADVLAPDKQSLSNPKDINDRRNEGTKRKIETRKIKTN
jgi:hypothetical protein